MGLVSDAIQNKLMAIPACSTLNNLKVLNAKSPKAYSRRGGTKTLAAAFPIVFQILQRFSLIFYASVSCLQMIKFLQSAQVSLTRTVQVISSNPEPILAILYSLGVLPVWKLCIVRRNQIANYSGLWELQFSSVPGLTHSTHLRHLIIVLMPHLTSNSTALSWQPCQLLRAS